MTELLQPQPQPEPEPSQSPRPPGSAKTRGPRKRACDSCYRRKIHCDGVQPHCDWCAHHGIACTYTRPMRKKHKVSNQKRIDRGQDEILQRITRLEQLVSRGTQGTSSLHSTTTTTNAAAAPSNTGPSFQSQPARHDASSEASSPYFNHASLSAPSPDSSFGASFGKLHFAGHQLGNINSFQGIPLFSSHGRDWIRERTGTHPAFPSISVPLWQNQHHIWEKNALLSAPNAGLPPRRAVETYFGLFRNSGLCLVFPIVHVETFQTTIDLAYSEPRLSASTDILHAQACILAFTCNMYVFEGCLEDAPIDGEVCAAQAQQLVPQLVLQPTIPSLQVILMLGIYLNFSGNIQLSTLHLSSACRLVYMLGAHLLPHEHTRESYCPEHSTQSYLRKLFWFCYTLDKDISLRTGQPPCLEDDYCDVSLPDNYDELFSACWGGDPRSITGLESSMLFVPGNLKLSLLKAKTSRLLYSNKALCKSDAELLREVRELDDELENWRLSLSPEWRPSMIPASSSQQSSNAFPPHRRMNVVVLHFEYYYLFATIHRATSRCRSWRDLEGGDMNGIGSSLRLTVQASRSTLLYLRATIHSLIGQCFWIILVYPMTAILTIFCNILTNPHDPQAQQDLFLLQTAPELIKQMRTRQLTPTETTHMTLLEDFITELIRLGRCAIQKARLPEA